MQIFSILRTCSFSVRRFSREKGFTLVELLISIGIIALVSALVLVKYGTFDSTVLLKGAAYEIAISIREAQAKSVSVARNSVGFDYPYGMTFSAGVPTVGLPDSKKYLAFLYASSTISPHYDVSEPDPDLATALQSFVIPRSMYISNVCVTVGTTETCSSGGTINRLDVAFRRPEYKAIFYAANTSDGSSFSPSITSAKIKLRSPNGARTFVVNIGGLGQISVTSE